MYNNRLRKSQRISIEGEAFRQSTPLPQDEPDFLVVGKDEDAITPVVGKKEIENLKIRQKGKASTKRYSRRKKLVPVNQEKTRNETESEKE